ncbi:hypothetical protein RI129_004792 [Pyrocoelia pectoralis]|uniref:Uncharacterized protein n=1 Tax=Pyrocoelia pectoralis TaxID=417401 RepID=A0AAN7ZQZ2_9COLE
MTSTFTSLTSQVVKTTRSAMALIKTKQDILRHVHIVRKNIMLIEQFLRIDSDRNENRLKLESNLCILKTFLVKLKQLKSASVKRGEGISKQKLVWQAVDSCFNDRLLTGIIVNTNFKDSLEFLNNANNIFSCKVSAIVKSTMVKANAVLVCHFIHPQNQIIDLKTFATKNEIISTGTDLSQWYQTHIVDKIQTKIEEFSEKDSGWALQEILHLKVNINKYIPLKGGQSTYVKVPHFIALKHAIVNVRNNDPYCFLWAIVSALHPAQNHVDRISSYPHFCEILNYNSIQFPIKLSDIKKFEKLNDLTIDVFCIKGKTIVPFY